MSNTPEYKMFFGRRGLTVEHEDKSGNFTFVFDTDPGQNGLKGVKERLILSKIPLKDMKVWECQTQADREHLALMLERVQQYLSALGYDSKVE